MLKVLLVAAAAMAQQPGVTCQRITDRQTFCHGPNTSYECVTSGLYTNCTGTLNGRPYQVQCDSFGTCR